MESCWTLDPGVYYLVTNELRLFNGNQPHCTLPFKGERYSLIYFSSSGHDRIGLPKDVQQCKAGKVLSTADGAAITCLPPRGVRDAAREFEYTFGYHVLVRRPSYRVGASMAWRWTSMALTRRWREDTHTHTDKDTKNTQVTTEERCAYAVSSLTRGARTGRRTRCAKLVKRERSRRDAGTEQHLPRPEIGLRATTFSSLARPRPRLLRREPVRGVPQGLRGAIVGVVMSMRRTRGHQGRQDLRAFGHLSGLLSKWPVGGARVR